MPRKVATNSNTPKELGVLRFDAVNIPTPYEITSNNQYVQYGIDNKYPEFLLKLYNESPIHSSIINKKAKFIVANGLKTVDGQSINPRVNASDTLEEFVSKLVLDYLIFSYFAIEVVYNKLNQPIEYHAIPAHKIRTNKDKNKFWYFDDICFNPTKFIVFDRWKPNVKDSTTKIFFFDGYYPSGSSNTYPVPEYHAGLKSILTDIEIRDFNLNNIKHHFSVSTLITFFMGINVAEEVKKEILNKIKDSYSGATGKKVIVDFQQPDGKSADIQNIAPNEWDKAYDLISQRVADDIRITHEATSPLLFGSKTEGQLGGTSEYEIAYEIFKNDYTRVKRNEILGALNMLFSDSELIKGRLDFIELALFNNRVPDELLSKIITINEFRAWKGLEAIPNGDRLIDETPQQTTQPQPVQTTNMSKSITIELTDEDYEKIKELGCDAQDFEFITEGEFVDSKEDFNRLELKFDTEKDIADFLINNDVNGKDLNSIRRDLRTSEGINVSIAELKDTIQNLKDSGALNVDISDGKIKIQKPEQNQPQRKFEVMYSYEVRPGYGAPIIEKTRPFCRKLVQNNRLYTTQEIQTMAKIFNYDIFKYGGGYYHNPDTGETTSHCRHQFKARTVVRKRK